MKRSSLLFTLSIALVSLMTIWRTAQAQSSAPLRVVVDEATLQHGELRATLQMDAADGSPIEALPSLEVRLDNRPVSLKDARLSLTPDAPLALALVIDVSATQTDLDRISAQLVKLRDLPNTRISLIGFGDTPRVFAPLTPARDLEDAQFQFAPSGARSALYAAVAQAADLLEQSAKPSERRLIIAITDSGNNTGAANFQTAIESVQRAQAALVVVGYGDKNRPADFAALADAVGGATLVYGSVSGFERELLARIQRAQQRWMLQLPVQAGAMAPRLIAVRAQLGDAAGSAQQVVRIAAPPPQVSLRALPAPGRLVTQPLTLIAAPHSELPLRRAVFLHNERVLGEVQQQPFLWTWQPPGDDAPPQQHTLSVRVEDAAGRQAQDSLSVNTAPPPRVHLRIGDTVLTNALRLPINGDQTALLHVEPSSSSPIVEVQLFVKHVNGMASSDTLLASRQGEPFVFELRALPSSATALRVEVRDALDQRASRLLPLVIQPRAAAPVRNPLIGNLLSALALVTLVGGWVGVGIFTLRWRRAQTVIATVQISNLGNLPALMRAEVSANPNWRYRWLGAPSGQMGTGTTPSAPRPASPATSARGAPTRAQEKALASASGKVRRALGVAETISGLADAIADLLPGALGEPFKRIALSLRQAGYQARQVQDRPRQVMRDVSAVRDAASDLAQRAPTPQPSAKPTAATSRRSPEVESAPAASAEPSGRLEQRVVNGWVLAPGEQRDVRLAVWPRRMFAQTQALLQITLSASPLDDRLTDQAVLHHAERSEVKTIQLGYASVARRFAPLWLASAVSAAALGLWAISRFA